MSTSTLPGFIRATSALVTSLGAFAPGDQHRADHEVGVEHGLLDLEAVRGDRLDAARVVGIQFPQPLDVGVEHGDARAEADAHADGVGAGDAAAEHDDVSGMRAGHARHEQPGAAVRAQHRVRADDRRQSSGDLAHRGEQGKRAGRQLHRLVGDRGDPARHQVRGELRLRREVQVGEEHEIVAEVRVLALDRLLDLEQQLGAVPDLGRGRGDRRRPRRGSRRR